MQANKARNNFLILYITIIIIKIIKVGFLKMTKTKWALIVTTAFPGLNLGITVNMMLLGIENTYTELVIDLLNGRFYHVQQQILEILGVN